MGIVFSLNILSIRMTITLETYDIDSKFCEDCELKCQVDVTLMHLAMRPLLRSIFSLGWVIICSIVIKLFSRRNPSRLFKR
jgi:hypothetical protein